MRNSSMRSVLLVFTCLFLFCHSSRAQFFKDIINTVKQTAQGRANNKADQATNRSIDKVDSGSTNRVFGAFSKSAAANPNDTSSADMTMKALGFLAGGGGVSAADSAAAIQSFKTASGGSGIFYRYLTTITSKKNAPSNDTSFTCFTNDGEGRKEMRIPMPGVTTGKIISIGRVNAPKYSVQLYPDEKAYGLTVIDTSLINAGRQSYQITKIGTETIQGYSCVHVKVKSTMGSGLFKSTTTEDMWTSTAVPGYALFKRLSTVAGIQMQLLQALDNVQAGGFIVKMSSAGKDYSMTMTLIDAQEKTFPASLFEIPSGYAQSGGNMFTHMISGAKQ